MEKSILNQEKLYFYAQNSAEHTQYEKQKNKTKKTCLKENSQ